VTVAFKMLCSITTAQA